MLRIVVLGAAAGGGFPQWNCACANCRRARANDPAARPRTQSSVAVTVDGQHWFLLNASPDLRQQILQTPCLWPAPGSSRNSPIAGVVLTNADIDHVAGLLNLRENHRLAVYGSGRVLDVLAANPIFDVLDAPLVIRCRLPLEKEVMLRPPLDGGAGPAVTAFAVPGKVALWLEGTLPDGDYGGADGDTIGLQVRDPASGACFFFIPGCAAMTPALSERLSGAAMVLFDGTTWIDDEMAAAGVGRKTARRMGHLSISGEGGTLAAFAGLGVRRKMFVHINNTNPVLIAGSAERRQVEAAGWEVAEDGMEILL
jgi:pyrroloquinoline quinone biosynthesis protein B